MGLMTRRRVHGGWVRQAAVAHETVSYLETTHHLVHFPSPLLVQPATKGTKIQRVLKSATRLPECPQSELAGAAVGTNGHQRRRSHPSSSLGCRCWAA